MGSSKKVDFAEGLLVFRALMGIRTMRQFSLLSEVEMGSHLLANVLYRVLSKKLYLENRANFSLTCPFELCFGYVSGHVCPVLWCVF